MQIQSAFYQYLLYSNGSASMFFSKYGKFSADKFTYQSFQRSRENDELR